MGVPSRRWVYVAFVTDVLRRIVGSQTTCRPVCTDLVLEPLRWPFGSENTRELISGSSASLATVGCSTSLVRYGQALVDCGWAPKESPFGFALAEHAQAPLCKAELIFWPGPQHIDAARSRHRRVGPLGGHRPAPLRYRHAHPAEHEVAWAPDTNQDCEKQPQPTTTGTNSPASTKPGD